MTREAAIRRLTDYVEHSLNGSDLWCRLKQYEALAEVDLTPAARNAWRKRARDLIATNNESLASERFKTRVPEWAQQNEL